MDNEVYENSVTIADIAKAAGVSATTVSYVLNNKDGKQIAEETKKRIYAICEEMGYVKGAKRKRRGEKKQITIDDIAREAGVSTATVSYIINNRQDLKISEQTRKKVLQICNLHQYIPSSAARSLAGQKSNTVGICFNYDPALPCKNDETFDLIYKLQAKLKDNNYSTLLMPPITHNMHMQENIDGIICIDLTEEQFDTLKEEYLVPIVAVDMPINDTLFFKTYSDFKAVIAYAKEKLDDKNLIFVTERYNYKPYMSKLKKAIDGAILYVAGSPVEIIDFVTEHKNDNFIFNGAALAAYCTPFAKGKQAVILHDKTAPLISGDVIEIYMPSELKVKAAVDMLQNAINRKESVSHTYKLAPQNKS